MSDAEAVSRWARRFVLTGALFLVAWQAGEVAGIGRSTGVVLGVFGFVLHTVFGKAYSLIPTYFDRELATPRVLPAHLALTAGGTVLLAGASSGALPAAAGAVGAVGWTLGVATFLGTIGWSIRDNLAGRETGTSDANAERRPVDRLANAFVPVSLAYLGVGSYAVLAARTGLPVIVDGYPPRASHLLAAGAAALLVFAVGFRLLPRFLAAAPPRWAPPLVLPAGAVGPAAVAGGLPGGWLLRVGALLEATAVLGFGVAYVALFVRSDRGRVGFYGVLTGAVAGGLAALLGLRFAFGAGASGLVDAHFRLNVLGFLGLTIVGAAYQFYPPAVGTFAGASDRTALASIALIGGGLLVEVAGIALRAGSIAALGRAGTLAGALVYAALLVGLFRERYG